MKLDEKDESTGAKRDAAWIRRTIAEQAERISGQGVKKAAMPLWLVFVLAVFPMGATIFTVAGGFFVGSYRLSQSEEVLEEMADTMKRVEGALSHMEVLEQRIVWLEKDSVVQERDIRMIETIARDNKAAVRNVAHDVATFRTFLPNASKGDG